MWGGYKVTIVFTMSGECQEFHNKLPEDMKTLIKKDKKEKDDGILEEIGIKDGSTAYFPYIPVGVLNYSSELVGLFSQLASYSLLQYEDDLKSLFLSNDKQDWIE